MRSILAILLLSCLTCFGQFGVEQPFFLTSSVEDAESLASTGLAYRWVDSDTATNTALDSWIDRISGTAWTNGASAQRPTNSWNQGIWFDNSHYFTNLWSTYLHSNCTFGFIMKPVDVRGNNTVYPALLYNRATTDGSSSLAFEFRGQNSSSVYNLALQWGSTFIDVEPATLQFPTNVLMDLTFSQWKSFTTNGTTVYTNGVSTDEDSFSIWATGTSASYPFCLMHNFPRNTGPSIWLRELWIWTNSTPTYITSNTLYFFHKYSTNKYGYSP